MEGTPHLCLHQKEQGVHFYAIGINIGEILRQEDKF